MRLPVSANRMQLLRLKKRLTLAIRGHKLLKDKQDELMRQFMMIVETVRSMRREVEEHLAEAFRRFLLARSVMRDEAVESALALPGRRVNVRVSTKSVLNVRIPVFDVAVEGKIHCYGFADTSGELDLSLTELDQVVRQLVELAQAEKTLELLADEIEKTRRRVNALEYILIPSFEETIGYITMKLSEMERSNLTRLMRIKDMVKKA